MGVSGGAPLYSLSVAWVSICEVLAPKRVLHHSLALFCLLPWHFQASENLVNKGVQRSLCYFMRPFSCLNGVNAIQGILSCISWIPSKKSRTYIRKDQMKRVLFFYSLMLKDNYASVRKISECKVVEKTF